MIKSFDTSASIQGASITVNSNLTVGQPHINPALSIDQKNINLQYTFQESHKTPIQKLCELVLNDDSEENIVLCNGAKMGVFSILSSLHLEQVICLTPNWLGYRPIADLLKIPFIEVDEDNVNNLIHDTRKTLIIVSSPRNPSGKITNIAELFLILKKIFSNFYLLVDEVYKDLQLSGEKYPSTLRHKNIIRVGSLSKSYAVPGLRIGYIVAHDEKLKKSIETINQNINTSINSYSLEFLRQINKQHFSDFNHSFTKSINDRLNKVIPLLRKQGFEFDTPKFGFYLWLKHPQISDPYNYFKELNVLGVSGIHYGGYKDYVRLSLACSEDSFINFIKTIK